MACIADSSRRYGFYRAQDGADHQLVIMVEPPSLNGSNDAHCRTLFLEYWNVVFFFF